MGDKIEPSLIRITLDLDFDIRNATFCHETHISTKTTLARLIQGLGSCGAILSATPWASAWLL